MLVLFNSRCSYVAMSMEVSILYAKSFGRYYIEAFLRSLDACGAIANGAAITGTAIGLAGATALGMAFPPVLLLIPASLYASKVIKEYQQDAAALKHEAVLEEMTLRGLTPHSSNLLLDQIIPCLVNVAPVCVGLALHDIGLSSHLTSTLASSVPSGPLDVSACYATASLPTTSGTTSTQIIRDGSNIVAMLTPSDGTSDLGHLGADATTGFVQGVSHMAQQAHLAVFGHAIPVVGNEFAFEGGYHASIAAANEGISILAGYGVPSALSTGLETMKSGSSTSSKPGMPNMRALKKEVRRKSGKTTA